MTGDFSCIYATSFPHSWGWENCQNLCKPSTASCIPFSNSPTLVQIQSVFIFNAIHRYPTEFTIHDILRCLLQLLGAVWRAGGWCPVVKLLLQSCFRRWFQSRLCNMYDDDWRCHLRHPHLVHRSYFARWVVFSSYMYWLSETLLSKMTQPEQPDWLTL